VKFALKNNSNKAYEAQTLFSINKDTFQRIQYIKLFNEGFLPQRKTNQTHSMEGKS
jgi:hypothetical protein